MGISFAQTLDALAGGDSATLTMHTDPHVARVPAGFRNHVVSPKMYLSV